LNITAQEKKQLEIEKAQVDKAIRERKLPAEFEFPVGLQFELTSACNLKCKHCYNRSGDVDKLTLMTKEKWVDFAKYLVSKGGLFQCILSGGEPLLLGETLFDIMDILHNDGTSFILITNGFLLNKDIADKLKKYRFYRVQISIDGANAETHDEFRGVSGSFDRAVRGGLLCSERGLPLVIANSIHPDNLYQMSETAQLAYEMGASGIMFGKIMPSGRAVQNREIILSEDQTKFMEGQIKKLTAEYSGRMTVQGSVSDIYQLNSILTSPLSGTIIRPNGDIRLDCVAPFVMGNILKGDFYELWNARCKNSLENKTLIDYISDATNLPESELSVINHVDNDIEI
jgi:MoaA/NifB/PqqE/SkfB family radical SAM enzyme